MANSDFNKITLMLPAGCGLNEAAETINGAWQKELSLFFSIEEVDEETFRKRLAEGDYTIALAPVSAESGSVYNTLAQFTPAGGGLTGYSNACMPPSWKPAPTPTVPPAAACWATANASCSATASWSPSSPSRSVC